VTDETTLQQAVRDLAMIRRTIEQTNPSAAPPARLRLALDARLLIHGVAALVAAALLAFELATGDVMSKTLRLSVHDPSLSLFGVANIGVALAFLVMCAYFIVWRAARHADTPLDRYLAHNFTYLRRLSFIGDLVVKLAVVSLIILGGKPQWLGPVLALFLGDYLIQGRLFHFTVRPALALGLGCFLAAGALFAAGIDLLAWPLGLFLLVSALAIIDLLRTRIRLGAATPEEAGQP